MKYRFDEIDYKKLYSRYVWISIGISIFLLMLILLLYNMDMPILDIKIVHIFLVSIASVCGFYLIISLITGFPFLLYSKVKKLFSNSYVEVLDNHVSFIRNCNLVDNPKEKEEKKYKITNFLNITNVSENSKFYIIEGEIDYFYFKTNNLERYLSNEDNKKEIIIKNKKGKFRIPKCFGEHDVLKNALISVINKVYMESNVKNNLKYKSFTGKGFFDLLVVILSTLLVLFSDGIFVILGAVLSIIKAIESINVLRELNRDRIPSIINIILGIGNFILIVLVSSL